MSTPASDSVSSMREVYTALQENERIVKKYEKQQGFFGKVVKELEPFTSKLSSLQKHFNVIRHISPEAYAAAAKRLGIAASQETFIRAVDVLDDKLTRITRLTSETVLKGKGQEVEGIVAAFSSMTLEKAEGAAYARIVPKAGQPSSPKAAAAAAAVESPRQAPSNPRLLQDHFLLAYNPLLKDTLKVDLRAEFATYGDDLHVLTNPAVQDTIQSGVARFVTEYSRANPCRGSELLKDRECMDGAMAEKLEDSVKTLRSIQDPHRVEGATVDAASEKKRDALREKAVQNFQHTTTLLREAKCLMDAAQGDPQAIRSRYLMKLRKMVDVFALALDDRHAIRPIAPGDKKQLMEKLLKELEPFVDPRFPGEFLLLKEAIDNVGKKDLSEVTTRILTLVGPHVNTENEAGRTFLAYDKELKADLQKMK